MKDFAIRRLSWIIQVGSKCNRKCLLHKREGGRGRFDTERRGEGNVTSKAEIQGMRPQTKECQEPPELEEARGRSSPRAPGGSMEGHHLGFGPLILILDL